MTSKKKPDVISCTENFQANFKNLFGFALSLSESVKPAPYFEGIRM